MKVKVKVHSRKSSLYEYAAAAIYSEDAKKLYELVEEFKRKVKEIAPYYDDIVVVFDIHDIRSWITPVELEKGIIIDTDIVKVGAHSEKEFIEKLEKFLRSRGLEPEFEQV